jgi:hypothetical protein
MNNFKNEEEIKRLRASGFRKDEQIKELRSVNSKNQITIARLREQCAKANSTNQAHITATSNAQRLHERCQELLCITKNERQCISDLKQQLARTEDDLRNALVREQRYLAEDERRLQERRAATQQWW